MAKEVLPLTAHMTRVQRNEVRRWKQRLDREGLVINQSGKHRRRLDKSSLTAGYRTKFAESKGGQL